MLVKRKHVGLIAPPTPGHLNRVLALGCELADRGHRVSYIGFLDTQAKVEAAGLEFVAIGQAQFPRGSLAKIDTGSIRAGIAHFRSESRVYTTELEELLAGLELDCLVIDRILVGPDAVAHYLKIPYIYMISGGTAPFDENFPPVFMARAPWESAFGRFVNRHVLHAVLRMLAVPLVRENVTYFQRKGLRCPPQLRTLTELDHAPGIYPCPVDFDFPRRNSAAKLIYTGSCALAAAQPRVEFPWDRLRREGPKIYVSFGTAANIEAQQFEMILAVAERLEVQVILSCGRANPAVAALQAAHPAHVVMDFVPQLEVLRRVDLFVTHAGFNSVTEALAEGLPLLAVPITADQPGYAGRIVHHGCGEMIPFRKLDAARFERALRKLLADLPGYRRNAEAMQRRIAAAGGVQKAADFVEQYASA